MSNQPSGLLSRDLIGTWALVSRIDRTAGGERRVEPSLGEDPVALLYYDRAGHFAAQFMKRDSRAAAGECRKVLTGRTRLGNALTIALETAAAGGSRSRARLSARARGPMLDSHRAPQLALAAGQKSS